ncbi:MAG: putative DNA binding domain-containing protein [Oscillospiraceae bacterium]|jgi:predicted HTH transcriptional regulator|nr:putative DNA binding domain-containing protein [Oscillospiraceae bacterium]
MFNWKKIHEYRENNRIEAKKAQGGLPKSVWETYCAFANTHGGYILLGVEELQDKSLKTVSITDPEKLIADFRSTLNNRQKVSVNILYDKHFNIVEVDGNRIVVIEIPRAERVDRPVYLGKDPFIGSYRRNGDGDYHCSKDEVRNMMRDQSSTSQDMRVLEQLDLDAFDYDSVRRYRIELDNTRSNHVWRELEATEFLQKLGCIARDNEGLLRPTSAGVLMFGYDYEIVKEYPNYFLDYQEHDNESTRWTDRIISSLGEWSGNLYDFYCRVAGRITQNVKRPFALEGMTRIDDTPVHKALREALANSLIHANYYDRLGLVIHKWPQSITIANPGSLRISANDAVSGGFSDPRNITLLKMFNLINIGDRAGTGLATIYAVWKNEGWMKPALTEQFYPDRTVLTLVLSPHDYENAAIKSSDRMAIDDSGAAIVNEKTTIYNSGAAIENGKAAIDDGGAAIENGKAAIENDKTAIDDGGAAIENGKAAIDDSGAAIENDKTAIDDDGAAIENDKTAIDDGGAAIENGKAAIDDDGAAIENENRELIILDFINEKGSGKNSDFVKLFGLRSTRVREILSEMVIKELIQKHGDKRHTYYTINDNDI